MEKRTDKNSTMEEQRAMIENKDLSRIMSQVLDRMGRYQIALFIALVLNGLIYGINHTLTAFHIYTPAFTCKESGDIPRSCTNITDTCPSGYKFDDDDYTIVVEWELVCSRRFLAPLVNTLYFVGVTLGALICGILSDKYGRKPIMLMCLFGQGVIGVLLQFSPVLSFFIVFRIIQGFLVQGLQGCCVGLLFEYSAPRLRTTGIVAWHVCFSSGALMLAGFSYGVRDWTMLQNMITIPTLVIACYAWAIPESIYWLYATNQKKKALVQCLKTARLNRDESMVQEINNSYGTEMSSTKEVKTETVTTDKASIKDIWNTSCLKKHLIVLILVNFVITISYYGSVFFLNKIGGDRHVNFSVGSCCELVGFILVLFLLKKWGTRYTIIFYQYGAGILCAVIGLIIVFLPDDNPAKTDIVRAFSLISKAIAMSAFASMILFNSELFPTICRGAAFGICGFSARCGSITAPFFMTLADIYSPIIPMLILSVLLIITGTASLKMPDTRKGSLPHTIPEAQDLWEKNK